MVSVGIVFNKGINLAGNIGGWGQRESTSNSAGCIMQNAPVTDNGSGDSIAAIMVNGTMVRGMAKDPNGKTYDDVEGADL